MSKNYKIISFLVLALAILLLPNIVFAFQLIPSGCTGDVVRVEDCGLTEIFQTFINFANFLLSIVGSVALLMFVFGGFTWLTSGGSSDKVKQGRDIMVNTAIGLAIVFAAATVIYSVGTALCRGDANCIQQLNIYSSATTGDSGIDCNDPENNGKPCSSEKHMVCSSAKKACVSECAASEDLASQGYSCTDVPIEDTENAANFYSQENPCKLNLCPGGWNNLCCKAHEPVVINECCFCSFSSGGTTTGQMIPQPSHTDCVMKCQGFIEVWALPDTLSNEEMNTQLRDIIYDVTKEMDDTCAQAIRDWGNI